MSPVTSKTTPFLVVDSGSTKADWAYVSPAGVNTFSTQGLNPYFHKPDDTERILLGDQKFVSSIPVQEISHVYFYGAGCSDAQFCQTMIDGLKRVFTKSTIEVEHDLLGAARATCGKQPGIAGILGTGSNSCLYDGKSVIDNITALAHVLGDDGGGVHLGKLILQAYFYRELPQDLHAKFEATYPEGKRAIIHRIYEGEGQNVRIAEFARFIIDQRESAFCQSLIEEAFRIFTTRHLMKYEGHQSLPINLVGSIADSLQPELKKVLAQHGLKLGKIIRRPIESLVEFHSL